MPRFYLHMRNGDERIRDEEGFDFADLAAARHEAIRGARSIMAAEVQEGRLQLDQSIEIHDAQDRPEMIVWFGEAVEITPRRDEQSGAAET